PCSSSTATVGSSPASASSWWSPRPGTGKPPSRLASSWSTGSRPRRLSGSSRRPNRVRAGSRRNPATTPPRSAGSPNKLLNLDFVCPDSVLVPLETDAGNVGDVQQAVLDRVGLLQDGVRPVLPFEPVRGLGGAHDVGCDFGI